MISLTTIYLFAMLYDLILKKLRKIIMKVIKLEKLYSKPSSTKKFTLYTKIKLVVSKHNHYY